MHACFHLSPHVAFVWYVLQLVVSEQQKFSIFSKRQFLLGRKKTEITHKSMTLLWLSWQQEGAE